MRVAAAALLALIAGAYAAQIDVQIEINNLKKSEHNSNTFFTEFSVWTSATGACAGGVTSSLFLKNAVNGPVALAAANVQTILAADDPDCTAPTPLDNCAQFFPWVPNKVANLDHCVVQWTAASELEAVVDYHNFPFDYQDWHIQLVGVEGFTDTYKLVEQSFPKHYFHIDGWRDTGFNAFVGSATNPINNNVSPTITYVKTVRREFTFYLSKYISNIILLVIMSAFTAFLPVNDSFRILLVLIAWVGMIFWNIAIADKLPSAAYPNRFDDFNHVSFAFLFAQFLYYTVHKAVYKEDNAEKTLGEDAADVPAGMSSAKKVDIVVHGVFALVYFIAVASVLGVATNLDD